MKKACLAVLLLCAVLVFGGCGNVSGGAFTQKETSGTQDQKAQAATEQTVSQDPFGSAKQLEGRIVTVAVFWEDAQDSWTQSDLQTAQRQLRTALDFLEAEAVRYGRQAEFCYSPSEGALNYRQSSPEQALDLTENMTSFYQEVVQWMDTVLPQQQLLEQYQAESVCYLLFLHKSGTSFTLPWMADVPQQLTQRELSLIYYYQDDQRIQRQCPYVYAHELLHQFGAIDLYPDSAQLPVSSGLPDYVARQYPDEIMGNNTRGHYYETELEQIGFEISPLTAYCLGWVDTVPELEQFPELTRTQPGALYSGEYYRDMISYPANN